MTRLRSRNVIVIVSVCMLLLIGITFASIFRQTAETDINVYKVDVTANLDLKTNLSDVVYGDTIINSISFSSKTESKDMYVRVGVKYYLNRTMTDADRRFLMSINYDGVPTYVGTNYKWVRVGNYYYLTDSSGNPLKITQSDTSTYKFCETVTYKGAVSIKNDVPTPAGLLLSADVQAINAKSVTFSQISQLEPKFVECFGGDMSLGYIVTFDTDEAGDISAQTFTTTNAKVTRPEEPTMFDYEFKGWYTDKTYTTEYDFDTVVTKNMTLYAKFAQLASLNVYASNIFNVIIKNADGVVIKNGKVARGTTITITATPLDGYEINNMTVGGQAYTNGASYTVTADTDIRIYTEKILFKTGKYTTTTDTSAWGYTNNENLVGKYFIEMGSYPQTLYTGNTSALTQVSGKTYTLANSSGTDTAYSVYTDGINGYVNFSGNYYKIEPVRWVVIGQGDGSALPSSFDIDNNALDELLVVSEKILTQRQFDPGMESHSNGSYNDFANAPINTFMNGALLNDLFNDVEKAKILTTSLATTYCMGMESVSQLTSTARLFPLAVGYQSGGYSDTYSANTLNDGTQVRRGSTYTSLKAKNTALSSAVGVSAVGGSTGSDTFSSWWLRTGYTMDEGSVCYVDGSGNVSTSEVQTGGVGVRPAFVFSLKPYTTGKYTTSTDTTSAGYTDNENLVGKYFIEMGSYPQTLYTGSETLTAVTGETYTLENSSGTEATCPVYKDSSGNKYVKLTTSSSSSDYYNTWTQYQGEHYYKIEPVRWVVIGKSDGSALPSDFDINTTSLDKLLVVSEKILTQRRFNPDTAHTTTNGDQAKADWKGSEINTFMNGAFMDDLFTAEQKARIQNTELVTTYRNTSGTITQLTNTSKMFSLAIASQNDVSYPDTYLADLLNNGSQVALYGTYASLKAKSTALATAMGVEADSSTGYGRWWLRSGLCDGDYSACYVYGDGNVLNNTVDVSAIGVRGAFVMSL